MQLVDGADATRLSRAAFLAGTDVMTVASAVGGLDVWEGCPVAVFIDVHAIADACAVLHLVHKNSGDRTCGDIDHVVDRAPSARETGVVAYEESQTLLLAHRRRWNARVQAEQISNRATVARAAPWADGSHVLHQRQQV